MTPATKAALDRIVQISADRLTLDGNPRKTLTPESISSMAESIRQRGILEPLRVVETDEGTGTYRVESGQRRFLGGTEAGVTEFPCMVVTPEDLIEERVNALVTNVEREDMNPVEEAEAYLDLTVQGLTPDGIAQRMGVAKVRVSARMDLLDLPGDVVELFRAERLPLAARGPLKEMATVSHRLAIAVAQFCAAEGNQDWAASLGKAPGHVAKRVAHDPANAGVVVNVAQQLDLQSDPDRGTWADVDGFDDETTKTIEQLIDASGWYKPRFGQDDFDAARAAGVLYEGVITKTDDDDDTERCAVIADPEWLRDRVAQIVRVDVQRRLDRKEVSQITAADAKRTAAESGATGAELDDEAILAKAKLDTLKKRYRDAVADGRDSAHAANQALGAELMDKLSRIPVGDLPVEVARALVHAAIGDKLAELFLAGLRYCLPEFIGTETKGKGDNERQVPVYVSGITEARKQALQWLERAKTAEEYVGRAVVMIGAAKYADPGVVPASQRTSSVSFVLNPIPGHLVPEGVKKPAQPADMLDKVVKPVVPRPSKAKVRPSQVEAKKLIDANEELAAKAELKLP